MVKNKKLFCLEPGSANVVHIDPELWNEDCGADACTCLSHYDVIKMIIVKLQSSCFSSCSDQTISRQYERRS